ncbi:3-oxoacyl-[acyl-carrier-protein] reductase FabG [Clostridium acetireducens DSM 10703]|uniref:3-oxoacyl-[acyl-carrier-protein] reductase FabG n=1 Tax=Clostridium acetireducens DSM 10703 TaxID=1121290 RepID=A0A1E8F0P8_9CLOT|nr:3-oxoacyl-[acyl-carrier-protein] reductase FabG [Clostridium acetireducens DSM 10703]
MSLSGKVAIITGASRGIGQAIAIEMAKEGANVIINYRKDEEGAKKTEKIIKENGGRGRIYKSNVAYYNEAKDMIEYVIKEFGKIDILVNNAGVSKVGLFIDMTEEDWDSIININLKGAFNCCHNVVKYMIYEKKGCIINISSMWGQVGASCEVIYSASKGGINSFTKALAKELGPSNIRVNAIAPGVIDTDMNKWLSKEEKKDLIEDIPLMKFGQPKDIGKLSAFLCSDKAKYITGQVINVDGGIL